MLLKDGEELDMIDKFEGYVFFVDIDMLLDGVFLFADMLVVVDMFVFDVVLCRPLLIPFPPEREVVHALGSRAFFRWQSTQYNKNFDIASRGIKAYKSATCNDIEQPQRNI